MSDQVVTMLLPALAARTKPTFNVFDVMRHGTHEKQLSNVFAWLLHRDGTHNLGDGFQRIFLDAVNRSLPPAAAITFGTFSVRQEVDVAPKGEPMDIADLVLEDDDTRIVIENFYTSDGHGHSYDHYLNYGAQGGKRSVVVMLCAAVDRVRLTEGWERAAIVSYPELVDPLTEQVANDRRYREGNPDQIAFFRHLHQRYVKESTMNDGDMIRFIDAMCTSGQAKHYRTQSPEAAAVHFADALREQAFDQFGESRAWLHQIKAALKSYTKQTLVPQLQETFGEGSVSGPTANYAGIYQWTINFKVSTESSAADVSLQLKFGPSAWFANEGDEGSWTKVVADPDYTCLFITRTQGRTEIRQSAVTLREVIEGLSSTDYRLRDELTALARG